MATLGPKENAVNSFPSSTEAVSSALIPSPRSSERNCWATVARMETVKVRSCFWRTVAFIIFLVSRSYGDPDGDKGCPNQNVVHAGKLWGFPSGKPRNRGLATDSSSDIFEDREEGFDY